MLAILMAGILASCHSLAEYINLGVQAQAYQHNYLPDASQRNTGLALVALDTTKWRRQSEGIFARGVAVLWAQGNNASQLDAQLPLYHWHPLHGVWLGVHQTQVNAESTLGESQSYLGDGTSPVDIAADSTVTSTWQRSRYQVFWRSDARYTGAANQAGLYWQRLTSPVEAELTGFTPTLFDLESEGIGFFVGQHYDSRGWGFSWQLSLGMQTHLYSDSSTQSHSISESERRMLALEAQTRWQYRYYLAPYWYLVPQLGVQLQLLSQAKSDSQNLSQKELSYATVFTGISLRRYFDF